VTQAGVLNNLDLSREHLPKHSRHILLHVDTVARCDWLSGAVFDCIGVARSAAKHYGSYHHF